MDHDILMRLTIWLTIATLCAVIVFAAFPFLDLRISPCSSTGRLVTGWAAARTFMFWRDVLRHGGEAFAVVTFLIFLGNVLIEPRNRPAGGSGRSSGAIRWPAPDCWSMVS